MIPSDELEAIVIRFPSNYYTLQEHEILRSIGSLPSRLDRSSTASRGIEPRGLYVCDTDGAAPSTPKPLYRSR
jgi:hypothetical protein